MVDKCKNNPGELASTPNCVNAATAAQELNTRYSAGKLALQVLAGKVELFALDNGSVPRTLDELTTRSPDRTSWKGPYAKPEDFSDPFGNYFFYKTPGDHGEYDLIFYGADGKPGGEGLNADYHNWN